MAATVTVKAHVSVPGSDRVEVRRFALDPDKATSVSHLGEKITERCDFIKMDAAQLCWKDADGDDVRITTDDELTEALSQAKDGVLRVYITDLQDANKETDERWPPFRGWKGDRGSWRRGWGRDWGRDWRQSRRGHGSADATADSHEQSQGDDGDGDDDDDSRRRWMFYLMSRGRGGFRGMPDRRWRRGGRHGHGAHADEHAQSEDQTTPDVAQTGKETSASRAADKETQPEGAEGRDDERPRSGPRRSRGHGRHHAGWLPFGGGPFGGFDFRPRGFRPWWLQYMNSQDGETGDYPSKRFGNLRGFRSCMGMAGKRNFEGMRKCGPRGPFGWRKHLGHGPHGRHLGGGPPCRGQRGGPPYIRLSEVRRKMLCHLRMRRRLNRLRMACRRLRMDKMRRRFGGRCGWREEDSELGGCRRRAQHPDMRAFMGRRMRMSSGPGPRPWNWMDDSEGEEGHGWRRMGHGWPRGGPGAGCRGSGRRHHGGPPEHGGMWSSRRWDMGRRMGHRWQEDSDDSGNEMGPWMGPWARRPWRRHHHDHHHHDHHHHDHHDVPHNDASFSDDEVHQHRRRMMKRFGRRMRMAQSGSDDDGDVRPSGPMGCGRGRRMFRQWLRRQAALHQSKPDSAEEDQGWSSEESANDRQMMEQMIKEWRQARQNDEELLELMRDGTERGEQEEDGCRPSGACRSDPELPSDQVHPAYRDEPCCDTDMSGDDTVPFVVILDDEDDTPWEEEEQPVRPGGRRVAWGRPPRRTDDRGAPSGSPGDREKDGANTNREGRTSNVDTPGAVSGRDKASTGKNTSSDGKATEAPSGVVGEPSSSTSTARTEELDARVQDGLAQMAAMGFTDDGGWMTSLLVAKQGDISAVLDAIKPAS